MEITKLINLREKITLGMMLIFLFVFFFISAVEAKSPTTGAAKALVLMVDFSDKVGQVQRIYFNDLMFGNHPSIAPLGSFTDYYAEVSYGQLSVTGQVNDGIVNWYRMPQTYSYYDNNQKGYGQYPQNAQKMVEDAVAAAKAAGVNFGLYDTDNDGYVDALFVIHAGQGYESTGCSCNIQSHYLPFNQATTNIDTGSTNARGNKVYVRDYTIEPEYIATPNDMTIGVFAHEFGHVLGLPDLYDISLASKGLGSWSLMAGGSWNGVNNSGNSPAHLDAWSKKKLRWVKPVFAPAPSGNVTFPQVEFNKSVYQACTATQDQEYFLIENRQQVGFDKNLPGAGLAIYHVDEAIGVLGSTYYLHPNDNPWYPGCTTCSSHYKIALVQADGQWDLEKNTNSGDSGDLYPGSRNNTSLSSSSSPNTNNYANQATGFSVTNISASSTTMTASVTSSSISSTLLINSNLIAATFPAAASYDGTNYFSVWEDNRNNSGIYNIYGARITECGKILDPSGFPITTNGTGYDPKVSFGNDNYFVTYGDQGGNPLGPVQINGAFINPSGQVISPSGGLPIIPANAGPNSDAVSFDGVNYFVAWDDNRNVKGTRVTPAGTVLDPAGIQISPVVIYRSVGSPSITYGLDGYMVVWDRMDDFTIDQPFAALVSPAGVVSGPITISNTGNLYNSNNSTTPQISYNKISNKFLATWWEYNILGYNANYFSYAQLINSDGTLSGGNQLLNNNNSDGQSPSVAFDGTNNIVLWSTRNLNYSQIYGTRISPGGVILDPGGVNFIPASADLGNQKIVCGWLNCLSTFYYYPPGTIGPGYLQGGLINP